MAKAREVGTLLKYVSESIIHREIVRRRSLPWADKIEAYIAANLSRRIDVPALAKATGFSVSFIHHRFKENFGMPPAQYVAGIKLRLARKMLLAGKTAKEAADALGFCDPFHFSRAFRKHFGHRPSSVRSLPCWREGHRGQHRESGSPTEAGGYRR
jgi:AraC-like DNA-binding protein